jgi:hypothetical protein
MKEKYTPGSYTGSVQHTVQLFDTSASRALAVAAFVRDGLRAGDRVAVVMRLEAWNIAAASLAREDVALDDAIASGRLTVLDADATLQRLMRDGAFDQARFDEVIGGLVARLTAGGHRLRAYGEMVDLLASEGNFAGAQRLEALWNGLQTRLPFTLFCGYTSTHFCGAGAAEALHAVLGLHTHTHQHGDDVLGTHLMSASAR